MDTAIILISAVAVVAMAVLVFGVVLLISSVRAERTRRTIVSLLGRKDAIVAGYRALGGLVEGIEGTARLQGSDPLWEDPYGEDRRAFGEVASQMRIIEDELKNTNVARSLENVVVSMEDAARIILEAAGAVEGAGESDAAFAATEIDLAAVAEAVARMESALHEAAEHHQVDDDDRSVYGGGLYI